MRGIFLTNPIQFYRLVQLAGCHLSAILLTSDWQTEALGVRLPQGLPKSAAQKPAVPVYPADGTSHRQRCLQAKDSM